MDKKSKNTHTKKLNPTKIQTKNKTIIKSKNMETNENDKKSKEKITPISSKQPELQTLKNESDNEGNETDNNYVIGIDLGTRFSCVSIWRNKRFEIICDQFGNRTIPSVVAFYKSAKLVGYNALAMKEVNPANTIYDIKRIIGRRMDDPVIEQIKRLISYEIIDDQSKYHNILVQLDKKDTSITHKMIYRPEEICSQILFEIKRMANNYLRKKISKAVITVPAYFNDAQRQATLDAAKIAGLDVLKIVNEPTAAALAYGLGNRKWNKTTGGNVIIYDLGAGTLDVSLMNISNGVFRTLAVGGNTHLGGEDIDYLVMNHVLLEFQKQHKIKELKISKLAQVKLKNSVEDAKKILSVAEKAVICVDDFCNGKKLYHVITREMFEMICNELFIMCMKPISDVLESSGLTKDDIDDVILVGGSTRIPKIQKLILDFFKKTNIKRLTCSLNPDEVVSAGASIYGYIMTHKEDPFSENLVLLDITPLSLGVETLQKQMTVIIPRNTVIPTRKTKVFSTDTDNQDTVSIKIFEGERKLTKNNFHVGTFDLSGFEKGPRGYPTIMITFHIDINGILHVTAHEKRSDVQNSIKITSTWGAKGRLSKNEIDTIIEEAEKNEQIDTMYHLKIGLVHKINSICNAILINLKDDAYALTNTDKKKIRIDVKQNLKWLKDKELADLPADELEKREERLSKTYAPLIAQVNKKNQNFQDGNTISNAAEVHGDDDDNENLQKYEKIEIPNDPSEYDKEEIKALKKTISDLGNNILSVVNNPVSKFTEEDIETVKDYIDSVKIWLYTTSANTTIEFVAKIDEINKFTEEIMKKYEDKRVFEKNDNFTIRDELQLTCLTLNTSIKSNFFSLKEGDVEKLSKIINETMIWLLSHQEEESSVYREKLDEISELCNTVYHNMHKMKILENINLANEVNDDSDEEDTEDDIDIKNIKQEIPAGNRIKENIDSILNSMPDRLINNKNTVENKNNSDDVLLKIDMNKLNSTKTFKYKNIEYHCR
ncbi:heat shock protein 70-like protein [Tupanvirus soda lake]|uniref:Heat shock protein 70-like protein n=2 Tax=Tupanvirus TaxID=2094720 RepID=A0A6N1NM12_9VIRU|nr:heat shock protein 70-like protein [Tupanvirus soda lake]QKU35529.1 heat shock protein 70-like protein [Tupanvirus soda lake]